MADTPTPVKPSAARYSFTLLDILFTWDTQEEARQVTENLFAHCTDRKSLYTEIVESTSQSMLAMMTRKMMTADTGEMVSESVFSMLRYLKLIADTYGKIYDPDQKLFSVSEDKWGILDGESAED